MFLQGITHKVLKGIKKTQPVIVIVIFAVFLLVFTLLALSSCILFLLPYLIIAVELTIRVPDSMLNVVEKLCIIHQLIGPVFLLIVFIGLVIYILNAVIKWLRSKPRKRIILFKTAREMLRGRPWWEKVLTYLALAFFAYYAFCRAWDCFVHGDIPFF